MNRSEYMKKYRKTHPEYVKAERLRCKLHIKQWKINAQKKFRKQIMIEIKRKFDSWYLVPSNKEKAFNAIYKFLLKEVTL